MACDPTTLASAAKCLNCLNPDELDAIAVQLMCNWATNGNQAGGGASAFSILTEANDPILTEAGDFLEIEH